MTSAFVLLTLLASQADSILKRGKPVPATPGITVGSVLANPTQYADAPVVLEGMVVSEGLPSIGVALGMGDEDDDFVPVYVDVR